MCSRRENYGRLSVSDLKLMLRTRGASLKGKKIDLIERLALYDENNDFRCDPPSSVLNADDAAPRISWKIPELDCYRDVNADSDLPPIKMSNIRKYLDRFNMSVESGEKIYNNHFMASVRVAACEGDYFFSSRCKASMKKAVTYMSQIKMTSTGTIEECQCDCAVGEYPNAHCKHVVACLLAVEHIKREGKIVLNRTSTQALQDFHKPKRQYFGSPVKAENLPNSNAHPVNFRPLTTEMDPVKYRERVRNMCIGYLSHSGSTMPFKQTIMPANMYAVVSDHNYALNTEEAVLKSLKVSDVTKEEINSIEYLTREQDKSGRWHDERRHHITASNFYSCCTTVSHEAKMNLAQRILNPQHFKTKQTQHGKDCEAKAIALYELYGVNVKKCGLILMKTSPCLGASPDGLIGDETVLEVKCPYNQRNSIISDETIPFLYADECGNLHLDPTHQYYFQIQGQLMVTGKKFSNLLVYTFVDFKIIDVPRDDRFIAEMKEKLMAFYHDFFKMVLLEKYLYKNYAKCFFNATYCITSGPEVSGDAHGLLDFQGDTETMTAGLVLLHITFEGPQVVLQESISKLPHISSCKNGKV